MNLKGKTIVLGITGGIAAYKMPNVAHALAKAGANAVSYTHLWKSRIRRLYLPGSLTSAKLILSC